MHFKLQTLVFLILFGPSGCIIGVPDADDGWFRCDDDEDCVEDEEFACVGGYCRYAPDLRDCGDSGDCTQWDPQSFCDPDSGFCIDPCDPDPCEEDDCVRAYNAEHGYVCGEGVADPVDGCNGQCPYGQVCVVNSNGSAFCANDCQNCPAENVCLEVQAIDYGGAQTVLSACVDCGYCPSNEVCTVSGGSGAFYDAAAHCAGDSTCRSNPCSGPNEVCVRWPDGSHRCESGCGSTECSSTSACLSLPGFVGGASESVHVCVACPSPCGGSEDNHCFAPTASYPSFEAAQGQLQCRHIPGHNCNNDGECPAAMGNTCVLYSEVGRTTVADRQPSHCLPGCAGDSSVCGPDAGCAEVARWLEIGGGSAQACVNCAADCRDGIDECTAHNTQPLGAQEIYLSCEPVSVGGGCTTDDCPAGLECADVGGGSYECVSGCDPGSVVICDPNAACVAVPGYKNGVPAQVYICANCPQVCDPMGYEVCHASQPSYPSRDTALADVACRKLPGDNCTSGEYCEEDLGPLPSGLWECVGMSNGRIYEPDRAPSACLPGCTAEGPLDRCGTHAWCAQVASWEYADPAWACVPCSETCPPNWACQTWDQSVGTGAVVDESVVLECREQAAPACTDSAGDCALGYYCDAEISQCRPRCDAGIVACLAGEECLIRETMEHKYFGLCVPVEDCSTSCVADCYHAPLTADITCLDGALCVENSVCSEGLEPRCLGNGELDRAGTCGEACDEQSDCMSSAYGSRCTPAAPVIDLPGQPPRCEGDPDCVELGGSYSICVDGACLESCSDVATCRAPFDHDCVEIPVASGYSYCVSAPPPVGRCTVTPDCPACPLGQVCAHTGLGPAAPPACVDGCFAAVDCPQVPPDEPHECLVDPWGKHPPGSVRLVGRCVSHSALELNINCGMAGQCGERGCAQDFPSGNGIDYCAVDTTATCGATWDSCGPDPSLTCVLGTQSPPDPANPVCRPSCDDDSRCSLGTTCTKVLGADGLSPYYGEQDWACLPDQERYDIQQRASLTTSFANFAQPTGPTDVIDVGGGETLKGLDGVQVIDPAGVATDFLLGKFDTESRVWKVSDTPPTPLCEYSTSHRTRLGSRGDGGLVVLTECSGVGDTHCGTAERPYLRIGLQASAEPAPLCNATASYITVPEDLALATVGYPLGDMNDGYVAAVLETDSGSRSIRLAQVPPGIDASTDLFWLGQDLYISSDKVILDIRVTRDVVAWIGADDGSPPSAPFVGFAPVRDFFGPNPPQAYYILNNDQYLGAPSELYDLRADGNWLAVGCHAADTTQMAVFVSVDLDNPASSPRARLDTMSVVGVTADSARRLSPALHNYYGAVAAWDAANEYVRVHELLDWDPEFTASTLAWKEFYSSDTSRYPFCGPSALFMHDTKAVVWVYRWDSTTEYQLVEFVFQ